MAAAVERALPEIGSFEFTVYSAARNARHAVSRFELRCDAVGLQEREILLLSVAGAETAIKAVTAALRSPEKDQLCTPPP